MSSSKTATEIKQLVELEQKLNIAKDNLRSYMALPENKNLSLIDIAKKITKEAAEQSNDPALKNKEFSLQKMLTCPIGVTYFSKFLESELNLENLLCYNDVLATIDFVSHLNASGSSSSPSSSHPLQLAVQKKLTKLVNKYLIDDSVQEVNLPASVKKSINNVFSQAISLLETVHTEDSLEAVNKALALLKDELLNNMNDPFSRYTKSEYFFELGAAFFDKKVDVLAQRERILQAASQKQENPSLAAEDFLNLQVRMWDEQQTARHPATVVEDLLSQLQSVLTNTVYLWDSVFNLQYDRLTQDGFCNWTKFKEFSSELSAVDLNVLKSNSTADQLLSFFINVHNVMLLHAAIEYQGIPSCAISWIQFARKVKYNIGGMSFSLDQISHGILRNNQRHVIFGKRFGHHDKDRLSLIPTQIPNQVVFSLITMQDNSPRLRIYSASQLTNLLDENTREYLKEYVTVASNGDQIQVPVALKSLAQEFLSKRGQFNAELVAFIKAAAPEYFANVKDNAKVQILGAFTTETKTNYGAVLPISAIEQIRLQQLQIIKNKGLAKVASNTASSCSSSDSDETPRTPKQSKPKSGKKNKIQHLISKAHRFAKKLFGIYA